MVMVVVWLWYFQWLYETNATREGLVIISLGKDGRGGCCG